jgi:hypothetical protein
MHNLRKKPCARQQACCASPSERATPIRIHKKRPAGHSGRLGTVNSIERGLHAHHKRGLVTGEPILHGLIGWLGGCGWKCFTSSRRLIDGRSRLRASYLTERTRRQGDRGKEHLCWLMDICDFGLSSHLRSSPHLKSLTCKQCKRNYSFTVSQSYNNCFSRMLISFLALIAAACCSTLTV